MLEIFSCQRHSLYQQTQSSLHIALVATMETLYLKCFFHIVFSARVIISVQFIPYHPHENRTSSDLANVETTIPCILFCSQTHNALNCFFVNRHTLLWKNGMGSHETNRPSYPSCTRSTPHTSLSLMSLHFVGLIQHFQ